MDVSNGARSEFEIFRRNEWNREVRERAHALSLSHAARCKVSKSVGKKCKRYDNSKMCFTAPTYINIPIRTEDTKTVTTTNGK